MRNLRNLPTKKIQHERCHAKSVERLIYKEHKKLNSIVLDDVEITNELGPLQKYTGKTSTRRSQSRCAV